MLRTLFSGLARRRQYAGSTQLAEICRLVHFQLISTCLSKNSANTNRGLKNAGKTHKNGPKVRKNCKNTTHKRQNLESTRTVLYFQGLVSNPPDRVSLFCQKQFKSSIVFSFYAFPVYRSSPIDVQKLTTPPYTSPPSRCTKLRQCRCTQVAQTAV